MYSLSKIFVRQKHNKRLRQQQAISKLLSPLLLAVTMLLVTVCSGCGGSQATAASDGGQGYTVTDSTGTKLSFSRKPQRIASMSIGTDEILLDMVPVERILCVTHLADDPGISNIVERAKAIPNRSYGNTPEAVLAMNPDLVLISDFFPPEAVATLRDMGLKVYTYKTPSNFQDIQNAIRELAQVVGEQQAGERIIEQMDARLARVKQQLGDIPPEKRRSVLYISSLGAYYSSKGTFRDTCRQAQALDATEALNYSQPCTLSQEVVVQLNPDSFIIGDWNFDGESDPDAFKQELLSNKSYMSTKAGKNQSVIIVPSAHLLTCSQHFVLGVEDLARAVYPEKFSN